MAPQVLAQHLARALHPYMRCGAHQVIGGVAIGAVMKVFHAGQSSQPGQQHNYQQRFQHRA